MKRIIVGIACLLTACSPARYVNTAEQMYKPIPVNGKLYAALFMQKAAEYKALCLQAYNAARWSLDRSLTSPAYLQARLAIITDIDETVLDNSPYAVHQSLLGKDYDTTSWYEWTDKAMADTIPGASSFLRYAASKGVHIFYVTNRTERERSSTLQNLQKYNLPDTDNAHLLLKQTTSGKEARRQQVMRDYNVILLIGDNLSDFSSLFDKKTGAEREANTDVTASLYGNRFIMLPNPSYGDWESALYQYNYNYTAAQKDSVIKSALKGY